MGLAAVRFARLGGRRLPGRVKSLFKLVAVKQTFKAGQQGKFGAGHQGPVLAAA
jgi:hypothetical protein